MPQLFFLKKLIGENNQQMTKNYEKFPMIHLNKYWGTTLHEKIAVWVHLTQGYSEFYVIVKGTRWLSGRLLDSRPATDLSLTGGTVLSLSKTH